MTPFPHLKETSQEAGGTQGVKKFQRKLQMNFKEDFFLGHPVVTHVNSQISRYGLARFFGGSWFHKFHAFFSNDF